jgi:hypothetical protein
MQQQILFVFSLMIFIACNADQADLPIDREKMVDILVDVHLAESALQETTAADAKKDSLGKVYYNKIFTLHQVKEADFNKSLYLIKENPEELDAFYKEVMKEVEKRMQQGQ